MTTEQQMDMPKIDFGPHKISRLIVGGNQQSGASHQTVLMTRHMLEYYTVDQCVSFLRDCIAQGIDTWQANYISEKVRKVVRKLRDEGNDINLISLSSPQFKEMEKDWGWAKELKPIGIYLFGIAADNLWREGKLDTARDFLSELRDLGVQVGLCSHKPEVIDYVEEKGWDVDFYMASLYRWGRTEEELLEILPEVPLDGAGGTELYLPSELPRMCETIRNTDKTCLAFKLFAGGRTCNSSQQVSDVFENVLSSIKPKDAVVVGMYPRFTDEITENTGLVKKFS